MGEGERSQTTIDRKKKAERQTTETQKDVESQPPRCREADRKWSRKNYSQERKTQ